MLQNIKKKMWNSAKLCTKMTETEKNVASYLIYCSNFSTILLKKKNQKKKLTFFSTFGTETLSKSLWLNLYNKLRFVSGKQSFKTWARFL